MPRRDWLAGPGASLGERVSLMRPIVRKISLPALSVLSSLGWLIAAQPAGAQTPPKLVFGLRAIGLADQRIERVRAIEPCEMHAQIGA